MPPKPKTHPTSLRGRRELSSVSVRKFEKNTSFKPDTIQVIGHGEHSVLRGIEKHPERYKQAVKVTKEHLLAANFNALRMKIMEDGGASARQHFPSIPVLKKYLIQKISHKGPVVSAHDASLCGNLLRANPKITPNELLESVVRAENELVKKAKVGHYIEFEGDREYSIVFGSENFLVTGTVGRGIPEIGFFHD